jgi:diguanylate cyclase (GGDEF)-like protein/PAS domain S-box-containing protein
VALVLSIGVLTLLPDGGPLSLLTGDSPASRLSRRLLIAATTVPVGLAWLRLRGEAAGLYDTAYGVALSVVAAIVLLTISIWAGGLAARRAELQAEAAQQERDRFFDLSLDMLAVAGPDGRYQRLNPAWRAVLGYSDDELLGRPYIDFVHPDDRDATIRETGRLFTQGKTVRGFQNRYRNREGGYRWLEWTATPSADGSAVYAVARDITTRKLEEDRSVRRAATLEVRNERLADRAMRDALTGLHNRRYFDQAVERLIAKRQRGADREPISAIMFDLDHFGRFNKEYGHQAGDVVLRRFADILRRRFRGKDLLARFGGEEFVVVLDGARGDDAVKAAEFVRERLAAEPVAFDGRGLHATVSAGCAELSETMSAADLITVADVGLSLAKRAGRNTVVAA